MGINDAEQAFLNTQRNQTNEEGHKNSVNSIYGYSVTFQNQNCGGWKSFMTSRTSCTEPIEPRINTDSTNFSWPDCLEELHNYGVPGMGVIF